MHPCPDVAGTSTITFSGEAASRKYRCYNDATSTVDFSDDLSCSHTALRHASNDLEFTQTLDYIGPIDVDAGNTITFEQSTRFPEEFLRSANDAILFKATAEHSGGTRRLYASNSITFGVTADNPEKNRSVTSEIEFDSVATGYRIKQVESSIHFEVTARANVNVLFAESTIDFAQHVRHVPFPVEALSTVDFDQNTRTNIKCLSAESTLDFSVSETSERPFIAHAESTLDFQGQADVSVVYDRSVHQYISWSHQAKRAHYVEASSEINFDQESGSCKGDTASNSITFDQNAYGDAGKPVSNHIEFTCAATCLFVKALSAASNITFDDAAGYYSSVLNPTVTPQPGILPEDTSATTCYLSNGETTIEFKPPNFGNRERLAFSRIQRETRGGTLRIHADPKWPKAQTFVMQFSHLTRAKANSIQDFIESTLGTKITFRDWEGQIWEGIIITPDNPVSEDRRDRCSMDFEFKVQLE